MSYDGDDEWKKNPSPWYVWLIGIVCYLIFLALAFHFRKF